MWLAYSYQNSFTKGTGPLVTNLGMWVGLVAQANTSCQPSLKRVDSADNVVSLHLEKYQCPTAFEQRCQLTQCLRITVLCDVL